MRILHLLVRASLLLLLASPAAVPGAALADPIVPGDEHCVINVRTDDRLNVRERPGDCGILVQLRGAGRPNSDRA